MTQGLICTHPSGADTPDRQAVNSHHASRAFLSPPYVGTSYQAKAQLTDLRWKNPTASGAPRAKCAPNAARTPGFFCCHHKRSPFRRAAALSSTAFPGHWQRWDYDKPTVHSATLQKAGQP